MRGEAKNTAGFSGDDRPWISRPLNRIVNNLRNYLLLCPCKLHSASFSSCFFTCNLGHSDLERWAHQVGKEHIQRISSAFSVPSCSAWGPSAQSLPPNSSSMLFNIEDLLTLCSLIQRCSFCLGVNEASEKWCHTQNNVAGSSVRAPGSRVRAPSCISQLLTVSSLLYATVLLYQQMYLFRFF